MVFSRIAPGPLSTLFVHVLLITTSATLLVASSPALGQSADTSSYFPLEIGNEWTYVTVLDPPNAPPDTLGGGTYGIWESIHINDTLYYRAPHPFALADTLRSDGDGRIWARDGGRDVLLFDFMLENGATYSFAPARSPDVTYEISITRGRTVEVSAGRFEDALALHFDDPQSIDEERSYTFSRGTGIVEASGVLGDYVELHGAEVYPMIDTLDWHGYLPLAVGNKWQYAFESSQDPFGTVGEWVEEWKIAVDTVIDARSYFEMEVRCDTISAFAGLFRHSCDPATVERRYIRYDETAANVAELDGGEERPIFEYDFRLDAPFYTESYVPGPPEGESTILRRYREILIGGEAVDVVQKLVIVYPGFPVGFSFSHGIGLTSHGYNEWGGTRQDLTYARVGSETYGTSQPVDVERLPTAASGVSLQVYPNPAIEHLTVDYNPGRPGEVRISLYDVLGRRVRDLRPGAGPSGVRRLSLDIQDLASGTYMLVLEIDGRIAARRSTTVIR